MNDEPIISWKAAGIALGLLLTLATFLVKPLGVSTQFVVTDAIVMHPGPFLRGIDIAGEVADSERSVIPDQVENGVAVRMALLELLAPPTAGLAPPAPESGKAGKKKK